MKILVCGDVHWASYSSILRKRGTDFSKRLENCINSVNWVEQTAEENECDRIIYLGDFFDRADISSEEMSALNEVQWSNIKHQIIVGNHELGSADGKYNTASTLNLLPEFEVINEPKLECTFGAYLLYLPYIFENDRKTVAEYRNRLMPTGLITQEFKYTYIFSHNDIKGINYGAFVSKEGFEVTDLGSNCCLCFNGHIHNGSDVTDKIINVGNLTGQNFNEDATKYKHCVYIIDTSKQSVRQIQNPYAYNFFKFDVDTEIGFEMMQNVLLPKSVVSVKCIEHLVPKVKEFLSNSPLVEEFRVVTAMETQDAPKEDIKELLSIDHLAQFRDYVLEKLGTSNAVINELKEVANVN